MAVAFSKKRPLKPSRSYKNFRDESVLLVVGADERYKQPNCAIVDDREAMSGSSTGISWKTQFIGG